MRVTVVDAAEAARRTADPVVVQEALFQQVQTDKRRTSRLLAHGRTAEAADLLRSTSYLLSAAPGLRQDPHRQPPPLSPTAGRAASVVTTTTDAARSQRRIDQGGAAWRPEVGSTRPAGAQPRSKTSATRPR
ncbi:hypothetical protein GCM10027047_35640 [Rhodococcus aerolatus]